MAKKGIAQITGSKVLKLGEVGHYHISKTYRPKDKANISHAKWKLYVKENNNWRELKPVAGTPPKIGSETTITITNQKLLGKELLLEAYLYEPEKSSPPGIVIKIEEGKKKIERVDLFRTDDSPISNGDVLKYGQSIIVKVITVNMPNEKVEITLYEDDENGEGHNANNEKNKVDSVEKRLDHDGFAIHTFKLPIDFQRIANAYMDGSQDKFHEYYINVKSATDSKASRNVNLPNPEYTFPEQEIEEVVISVKAKEVGIDPLPETGRTVSIVKEVKIEGLLDAYFAKKEYTKQTGEDAGTVEYTFGSNGNKTSTDAEKEKIAKIIVGKSQITSLKNKKEYTTVEAIKTALTATVYNKDQKITIKTFKLGEDFKRVNSAPLEEKLYLVATTSMLDGKEATIIIKEKDGIKKGSAGAVLPVLEITEEQMEQKTNVGEIQGTEKTEFKGTVQEGIVKIPIQLRPKSDDELKQWKGKLAKGKQDGTYTYTFENQTSLPNGSGDEKKRVAQAILTNAKEGKKGNPKIEAGNTAFADDIEKALVKEVYLAGQTISFPLYKKETELLYLQAKAQGEKLHDKEFLKQDGAYFKIGGNCVCEARIKAYMRMLRIGEGTGELIKSYDAKEKKIIYIPHNFDKGYTMLFGGGNFTQSPHNKDMSSHPNIKVYWYTNKKGEDVHSSAAGAYQVMGYTWNDNNMINKRKTYNIKDFSPESQDKFCIVLFKHKREGMIDLIVKGDIKGATEKYGSYEWASLPPGQYGQPNETMEKALEFYEKFYEEELLGKSPLHIKDGFLKDFDINCNCGNSEVEASKGLCSNDRSQCFEYADVWENPEISSDNGGKNNNRYGSSTRGHKGVDILSGPTYKDVHSIMCGTVEKIVNTFKTNEYGKKKLGNVVNIKSKDKKGNTVYILYCHLDKIYVSEGQKVAHGQKIALSGSTGNAAEILDRNGNLLHGIWKKNWHCHIEACEDGAGAVTFFGKNRLQPEDYMKTKFDKNGNAIK